MPANSTSSRSRNARTRAREFAETHSLGLAEQPGIFDHLAGQALGSSLVRAHQQAATGKGGGQKGVIRLWGVPEVD